MKIKDINESVAGPEKCWPGHRKVGTQPGTGKNAGKRVNDCEKIKEDDVAEGSLNEFVITPDDGPGDGKQAGRWLVTYMVKNGITKEKIMVGKNANAIAKYFEFKYRRKPLSVVPYFDDMDLRGQLGLDEQGVAEAGNKPLEKSRFGTGDTRTPRDIKSQMSGASDEFVRTTAGQKTGPFHSKVAKMQGKMAKSELRKREQGVEEAYQFKGPFPFDVDHMHGGRGINLPKAETKKYFTDKKQWERAVNDINSSKYDDNSDYIGVTGRSTVEINGREWARWSDAQQKGYIELSSMSEQGVAEGSADTVMFEIDSENAYNHVMKQFGSVVEWDGDAMVAPRKYWGSIQELAYSAGGEATEVGNEQGIAEDYNPEYDDEAGMADNNLETLARAVEGIDDVISAGDNLPEWCQEKIAVAKSMLVAVWDYMKSEENIEQGVSEGVRDLGYDAQSLIMKLRRDVEEKRLQPTRQAVLSAARELAGDMDFAPELLVRQVLGQGVSEGICSIQEANEIFDDFERSVAARGLTEDIFDSITDEQIIAETAAWRRKEGKSAKGGLNAKGVASYRRENPGSKLQTAVTTKPSKLKKGSKAAKRRKSFCARMGGVKGPMKKPNGKPTRKALALRKWNC
jgi:hypothetical protein